MIFYLIPKDPLKADWEYVTIGEESFGTFYAEKGLDALVKSIDRGFEDQISIKDEKGKVWDIQKFLDILETLKIRKN